MSVLVIGAGSQVGCCLLPLLRTDDAEILALSRRAPRAADAPHAHWLRGALPAALPLLPPLRRIYSAGPLDALAQWLRDAPLAPDARVLATSSMSAVSKQQAPGAAERALAARLRAGERLLIETCRARGIGWTVLRPTLIYGVGRDRSLTPLAQRAQRWRVFPLPAGRGLRQPVHAADVAAALHAAGTRAQALDALLEIGGGERLPAAAMFARVHASLPFTSLGVPLPRPLLRLGRLHPRLRGPLTRLDQDLLACNDALIAALGVRPRAFAPDAQCWGF